MHATPSPLTCRLCGHGIRDADAVAKVAGDYQHAPCAEAAFHERADWAHTKIGTINQLSLNVINGVIS